MTASLPDAGLEMRVENGVEVKDSAEWSGNGNVGLRACDGGGICFARRYDTVDRSGDVTGSAL